MPEADQEGMKSFETREAKEVVGVVVKKFTANPAKGQLVVEFIAGKKAELGAKKANHAVGVEKKELKDNAQKRQPPSEYDNVRQVKEICSAPRHLVCVCWECRSTFHTRAHAVILCSLSLKNTADRTFLLCRRCIRQTTLRIVVCEMSNFDFES